jgi:hypothetical protein
MRLSCHIRYRYTFWVREKNADATDGCLCMHAWKLAHYEIRHSTHDMTLVASQITACMRETERERKIMARF